MKFLNLLKRLLGMHTYQLKDANGNVVASFTIPVDLAVGTYTVTVAEGGGLGGGPTPPPPGGD